jgi:hypothetical protein
LYRLLCLEYYYYQEPLSLTPDPGNTSPVKQSKDIYETRCYYSIQPYLYYRKTRISYGFQYTLRPIRNPSNTIRTIERIYNFLNLY